MHPDLLFLTLETGVPLALAYLQSTGMPPPDPTQRQQLCAALLRHGDELLYGGRHAGAAMAQLIQALAWLALAPGGVRFGPCHWATPGDTSRGPRDWSPDQGGR